MENDEGQAPAPSVEQQRNMQVDNAIRAIQMKKPLPEVDFTLHTLESGEQVNTTERVCKGMAMLPASPNLPRRHPQIEVVGYAPS